MLSGLPLKGVPERVMDGPEGTKTPVPYHVFPSTTTLPITGNVTVSDFNLIEELPSVNVVTSCVAKSF